MKKFFVIVLMLVAVSGNGQWVQMSNGMGNNKTITSFVVSGTNIFAGTYGSGIYLSTNYGVSWTAVNNGLTGYALNVYSLTNIGTNLFAGTFGSGVFKSTNNGTSWLEINNGLPSYNNILSFTVSGTNIFSGTMSGGVFKSTNYGANWDGGGLLGVDFNALKVLGTNIFAGTNKGVYLSTDNGIHWTAAGYNPIYDFKTIAVLGGNLFVGGTGVFYTSNNGASWISANYGLPNSIVYSLIISGTNMFAGISSGCGVYLSTNNGTNWLSKNQGFSNVPGVYAVVVTNNYIFAGTDSSVWRRSLSEIIGVQNISTEIPSAFSLKQNYPNPFNPRTVVSFSLPVGGDMSIKVYDVQGREVQTLVKERLSAGNYEVTFDGSGLTSGVYFYRMQAGGYTETKRMILIK